MKKDKKEFDIFDFEKTEHQETTDYIGHGTCGIIVWEGMINTPKGIFNFQLKKSWTEDNGGESAEVISDKPKDMAIENWDNLCDEIQDYVLEAYHDNKSEWEETE